MQEEEKEKKKTNNGANNGENEEEGQEFVEVKILAHNNLIGRIIGKQVRNGLKVYRLNFLLMH